MGVLWLRFVGRVELGGRVVPTDPVLTTRVGALTRVVVPRGAGSWLRAKGIRWVAVPVHWGTLAVSGLARARRMRKLLVDPPHEFAASGSTTRAALTEPGCDVALPDLVRGPVA